ncbi:MAG: outer membrane beta-barrel protein [Ignavibacteria bacterium]|nr:outer membrane beta-barrel protein [Ignavibacteria bacterium]
MKKKILTLLLFVFILAPAIQAQFDKPQIQLGIGVSEPYDDLKGTYYSDEILGDFYVQTVNPDFMTKNYGGKTGLDFFGKGKINFDKYSTVRGILNLNFNTFNTFESSKNGNIGVQVININNELDTVITSVSNNYTFNNFGLGLGLEIAPTSFTNLVSPYFGGSFNFNFMSGELSRTENRVDTVAMSFSDFRMGVTFDAGIEAKVNSNFGLALGVKYDLGNLFLKNTNSGIADAIEYGKSNASMNDEEGRFYSSIYGPVLTSVRREVQSNVKEINWGTIYLAVNIGFNQPKTKKPKTQSPK